LELCARAGFSPRIAFETDNFVAVEGLVARGIGVATLPRLAVASFPRLPGVTTVPLPPSEARTIHVVTAHGADRVPAVRATLAAIERLVGDWTTTGEDRGRN
jgi:DNA-binding transcriptional LysR family regulator